MALLMTIFSYLLTFKNKFMYPDGPVIIIEDDIDDQDVLTEVFQNLKYPNELIFFTDGEKALDFISARNVVPFIILSDINLPKLSGFERDSCDIYCSKKF